MPLMGARRPSGRRQFEGTRRTPVSVDCGTYIERYLSAHADGELSGEELRAAEAHVSQCAECRERLDEERALKRLLHDRLALLKTPDPVRDRIRAALHDEHQRELRSESAEVRRAARARWLRPRIWAPAALAALLIIALAKLKTAPPPFPPPSEPLPLASSADSIPIFDVAIGHLDRFERKFEPNVPSGSPADISDAYLNHKMPGYLWNFGPGGYRLVGGRLERLPDGKLASFTYYQGDNGAILCTYMHAAGPIPPGAVHETDSHAYYSYKGYSICLSKYPRGDFICILATRRPMAEFIDAIAASSL